MSEIHIPLSTLRRVYKYAERNHITGMEAVASYVDSEKLATRAAELEAQLAKRKQWTRFLRKEMKMGDELFELMTEKAQEWQGKCFKLQAENERLRDALKEIMRSPKCINPSCTIDNPLCNTMIAVAALKGGDK